MGARLLCVHILWSHMPILMINRPVLSSLHALKGILLCTVNGYLNQLCNETVIRIIKKYVFFILITMTIVTAITLLQGEF